MLPRHIQLEDGLTLVIREGEDGDAASCIEYLEKVASESDFLTFGPGEFRPTLAEEKEVIEKYRKADNKLFLVSTIDNKIVSISNFDGGGRPRTKHAGEFGITVLKEFWNLKIGSNIIETLIGWAKKTGTIRKINLKVDTENKKAIRLYEKFGFKKEGTLTRESLINGELRDSYIMGLDID